MSFATTGPTPDHPTLTSPNLTGATIVAVCPAPLWPQSNGYALRVGNLLTELDEIVANHAGGPAVPTRPGPDGGA